ncbi:MAG: hypothetical protein ACFFCW_37135 [Candidatus Hodarchaeota archaeon]
MKAYEYILAKQIQWALNRGIRLIGSKAYRGRPAYTFTLEQNLFEPLEPDVRKCFKKGDGSEINGSQHSPAKMQAVHSSSALSVNIFQYWQKIDQVPLIATICGFCQKGNNTSKKIEFEEKYSIDDKFRFAPNIDVVIHNSISSKFKRFAIECKFSESYSSQRHLGIKPKYINLYDIWNDIPAIYHLAKSICPDDKKFLYLHPAQLIKHILGLKKGFGKEGFRLLYLWYDVLGEEGAVHRKEIEAFSEVTRSDGIKFHSLSYQKLIVKLSNEYRLDHGKYIKYLSDRYL